MSNSIEAKIPSYNSTYQWEKELDQNQLRVSKRLQFGIWIYGAGNLTIFLLQWQLQCLAEHMLQSSKKINAQWPKVL